MKKILVISPYFPFPARDGGKVRLYNLIKHLSKENKVYLLAYIEPNADKSCVNSAKEFCTDVFPVLREEDKRIIRVVVNEDIDEFTKKIEKYKPLIIDEIQIDFEELFIIQVESRGYLNAKND